MEAVVILEEATDVMDGAASDGARLLTTLIVSSQSQRPTKLVVLVE